MKINFKLLAYLFIALSFVISGCSDDDDNPTDPGNGGGGGNAASLSGTIQMWTLGSGKVLKAQVEDNNGNLFDVGTSEISSNGAFTLQLSAPPANALTTSDLSFSDIAGDSASNCTGGFTVSDNTAKAASLMLNVYDGSTNVGEVVKAKIDATTFTFGGLATWTYLDKSTNVTGSVQCDYFEDPYNIQSSFTSNLSLQPGWNISTISSQVSFPDTVTYVTSITLSNGEASGMTWFFNDGSSIGKAKFKK